MVGLILIFIVLAIFVVLVLALFIFLVMLLFLFMAVLLVVNFKLAKLRLFLPKVCFQYFFLSRQKEDLELLILLEVTNYSATLTWPTIHFIQAIIHFILATRHLIWVILYFLQVTLHLLLKAMLNFLKGFTSWSSLLSRVFLQLDFEIYHYFSLKHYFSKWEYWLI